VTGVGKPMEGVVAAAGEEIGCQGRAAVAVAAEDWETWGPGGGQKERPVGASQAAIAKWGLCRPLRVQHLAKGKLQVSHH
jgi:hypothetical protein